MASRRSLTAVPIQGPAGFSRAIAIRRSVIIEIVMGADPVEPHSPRAQPATWNDPARIAFHRQLTPGARVQLMIEASRAVLRFARGRRVDDR
jgi:hypothetical protein